MRALLACLFVVLLGLPAGALAAPTASFTYTPSTVRQGSPVTFTSTSACDRAPCTYLWTDPVDNGTYSRAASFSFTFNGTGSRSVRLKVTNSRGASATTTRSFTVLAPAPSPTPTPSPTATPSPTPTATPSPTATPTPSPTPTPDPTPDPRTLNCAPAAADTMTNTVSHLCGFADTTNTGVPAGTTLRRVPQDVSSGPGWSWSATNEELTISGNGAVVDGLSIPGTVTITGSNATIRNSRIQPAGDGTSWGNWGVALVHATGATIENNTMSGTEKLGPGRLDNAIRDIYGDSEGFRIAGNHIYWASSCFNHIVAGGVISGNYCHDMGYNTQTNADHTNGLQTEGSTGTLLTVQDNTILVDRSQTDAIMISGYDSQQRNRTIDHNLLAGGGWTVYGMGGANENAVGIRATGNHFSRMFYPESGYWGPVAYWNSAGAGNVWSGNVWDDTGQPVGA